MNTDDINPQNLRIYGNGGAMLPFANSAPRYDDLQENAIFVQGQNDGKFNSKDYILFYGESPTHWTYSTSDNHYHHQVNWYSDTTYYFITSDLGPGKRIQPEPSTSSPATETVTKFDDYAFHEVNAVNWLSSGREWYGEKFDEINNSYNFQFSFPNHVDTFYVTCDAWARSINSVSTFYFYINGSHLLNETIPSVTGSQDDIYAYPSSSPTSANYVSGSDVLNMNLKYTPSALYPEGEGWLNFIEINGRRTLTLAPNTSQLEFRNIASAAPGMIAEYDLGGSSNSTQVWEITDPLNISSVVPESNSGGTFAFRLHADSVRQFLAFDGTLYYTPALDGKIENQNLHGLTQADMIIVAYPGFMSPASRLAQFHRDHDKMTVQVATTDQIYNEFSSGKQDVTAIRDFVKMFYDRAATAGTAPQCLLMFGRGSYDPKNRIPGNTNYVVCYESADSNDPTSSYMSDDFFAFLDDDEGDWDDGSTNLMDIGVGRLPAKTSSEGDVMVDKIIHYATPGTFASAQTCVNNVSSSLGDWRNVAAFVADDGDENIHFQQTETIDGYVGANYMNYNIDKLYVDAYKEVVTPGGNRYPDCEAASCNGCSAALC